MNLESQAERDALYWRSAAERYEAEIDELRVRVAELEQAGEANMASAMQEGQERARLRAELAASQERERRLREAGQEVLDYLERAWALCEIGRLQRFRAALEECPDPAEE